MQATASQIRVLLADDHKLFRQGLRQLLELDGDIVVVGEAGDGQDAQRLAADIKPDVVLVDINMPGGDGVSAAREILRVNPGIGVIVLTMHRDDSYIFQAVRAGARAYLLKSASAAEVALAVRIVHQGASWLDPETAFKVLKEFRRLASQSGEYARGLRDTLIADRQGTLELHRSYVDAVGMLASLQEQRMRPDELAGKILEQTKRVFRCNSACLLAYNRWENKLTSWASSGFSDVLIAAITQEVGTALENGALPAGTVLTVSQDKVRSLAGAEEAKDIDEALVIPMMAGDALVGVLALAFGAQQKPKVEERLLLVSLAGQVALVLQNAALYRDLQELAVAEERRRIAREIHDGVAQNLVHLMMKMELIQRMLEKDPDRALQEVVYSRAILEQSVQELRRCIQSLRPPLLTEGSLAAALYRLTKDVQDQTNIITHVDLPSEDVNISTDAEVAIFRIVQEALNNVRKHASANNVFITLREDQRDARLIIEDDGIGFDAAAPVGQSHFGLRQMKERANSIGGTISIDTVAGSGTRVAVVIPLVPKPR